MWVAKRRCQPDAAAELWRIRDPERLEGAAVWRKPRAAMEIFLLVLPFIFNLKMTVASSDEYFFSVKVKTKTQL